MVLGMVPTYWEQNTDIKDFKFFSRKLIINLRNRGYELDDIANAFRRAAQRIDLLASGSYIHKTPEDR